MPEKISTAEEIKQRAAERLAAKVASDPGELLTLPSALSLRVRRPAALWWALKREHLPQSLAARVSENDPALSREELIEFASFIVELLTESVIEPRIRLNPGPEEVDPNWLSEEDLLYIVKFVVGGIDAQGRSFDSIEQQVHYA